MKSLTQFITEKQNFLINSKINSAVKSSKSNKILYIPKSWNELYEAIKNLLDKGIFSYARSPHTHTHTHTHKIQKRKKE